MESEISDVCENLTSNGEISPAAEESESDLQIDPPPSCAPNEIEAQDQDDGDVLNSSVIATIADSSDEMIHPDSDLLSLGDESDPPVPIIVEDNPADRKALKSCLRSKSKAISRENSESENSSDNLNNSIFPLEGCSGEDNGDSTNDTRVPSCKKDRKVRFYLMKRKAKPSRIENPGKTTCITRRRFVKRALNTKPSGSEVVGEEEKNSNIPSANPEGQDGNLSNTGYRKKHDACVTQPDVLFFEQSMDTAVVKTETSAVKLEKEIPNQRCRDSKSFQLKESVLNNISSEVEKSKPTIVEKLHMVNAVPNSTLSSAIRKELEVRKKEKFNKKHNVSTNKPKQNVILRKSLLTDACANISTFISNVGDKLSLPNKDIPNSMHANDSMENVTAGKLKQSDHEDGDQCSETGKNVLPLGKQKQTRRHNSQKRTRTEFKPTGGDLVSDDDTSKFSGESEDNTEIISGKLQTCSKSLAIKLSPKFPSSPKGKQAIGSNEDERRNLGRVPFLPSGKTLQTTAHLPLFNMNTSPIAAENENIVYEDFGSLAQKLKRCRKSPVPVKFIKGSPEGTNAKNVGDEPFSVPETGEDVISRLSEKALVDNDGLSSFGSSVEKSQNPLSTPVKKSRLKRERKNSKSNQNELCTSPSASSTVCKLRSETGSPSLTNICLSTSQLGTSDGSTDSKSKESISSTRTTSVSEEASVKGYMSKTKSKHDGSVLSIIDLSEISSEIPKIPAVNEKNTTLSSKKSSLMIECLDLAGAEKKTKERLIAITPEVVESLGGKIVSRKVSKGPLKGGINLSVTKNRSTNDVEHSKVQVINSSLKSPYGSPSLRKGRKIAQISKHKDASRHCSEPPISAENDYSSELTDRGEIQEETKCSSNERVGEKNGKLPLSTKENEIQGMGATNPYVVSYSPQGPLLTMKRKKNIPLNRQEPLKRIRSHSHDEQSVKNHSDSGRSVKIAHSPKVRKSIAPTRFNTGETEKGKISPTHPSVTRPVVIHPVECNSQTNKVNTSLKVLEIQSPVVESELRHLSTKRKKLIRPPLMCISISPNEKSPGFYLGKCSDSELLQRYAIKSCCVKLEKLTSEDIKRHSCFASKGCRFKKFPNRSISPKPALKKSSFLSPRNISIIPENIPKLQKVMEDVISSDDESWLGWHSIITDIGQGFQLVSIMEDSKVTQTLVSSEASDYPVVKFCDKSTDTSDLGQM